MAQKITLIIFATLMNLFFQNCAPTKFSSLTNDTSGNLSLPSSSINSGIAGVTSAAPAGSVILVDTTGSIGSAQTGSSPNVSISEYCNNPSVYNSLVTNITQSTSLSYSKNKCIAIKGDNLVVLVDGAQNSLFTVYGNNNTLKITDLNNGAQVGQYNISVQGSNNNLEIDGFQNHIEITGDSNNIKFVGHYKYLPGDGSWFRGTWQNALTVQGNHSVISNVNEMWQTSIQVHGNGTTIFNQGAVWQNTFKITGDNTFLKYLPVTNLNQTSRLAVFDESNNMFLLSGNLGNIEIQSTFSGSNYGYISGNNNITLDGVQYNNQSIGFCTNKIWTSNIVHGFNLSWDPNKCTPY